MNEPAGPAASRTRGILFRYAALTLALTPAVLGGIVGAYFVRDHPPPRWIYWAAGLIACRVVDVSYIATVATACIGLPLAILSLHRRRTRRARWLRIATLSGSILLGSAVLEAASWILLGRQAHQSVMSAGDVDSQIVERVVDRKIPVVTKPIELPTTFPADHGLTSIAVVGESSALGVPFDRWLSIGRLVAYELGRAIPGRRFEPEIIASAGETLETQHRQMRWLVRFFVECGG